MWNQAERFAETASCFVGTCIQYLGIELQIAGETITEVGQATGDFIDDHVSNSYDDPAEEWNRVKEGTVNTVNGEAQHNEPLVLMLAGGRKLQLPSAISQPGLFTWSWIALEGHPTLQILITAQNDFDGIVARPPKKQSSSKWQLSWRGHGRATLCRRFFLR